MWILLQRVYLLNTKMLLQHALHTHTCTVVCMEHMGTDTYHVQSEFTTRTYTAAQVPGDQQVKAVCHINDNTSEDKPLHHCHDQGYRLMGNACTRIPTHYARALRGMGILPTHTHIVAYISDPERPSRCKYHGIMCPQRLSTAHS